MARRVLLDAVQPRAIHSMYRAGSDRGGRRRIRRVGPRARPDRVRAPRARSRRSHRVAVPRFACARRAGPARRRDRRRRAPAPALTFTFPAIARSPLVVVTVSGADKRDAMRRIAHGEDLPAARIRGRTRAVARRRGRRTLMRRRYARRVVAFGAEAARRAARASRHCRSGCASASLRAADCRLRARRRSRAPLRDSASSCLHVGRAVAPSAARRLARRSGAEASRRRARRRSAPNPLDGVGDLLEACRRGSPSATLGVDERGRRARARPRPGPRRRGRATRREPFAPLAVEGAQLLACGVVARGRDLRGAHVGRRGRDRPPRSPRARVRASSFTACAPRVSACGARRASRAPSVSPRLASRRTSRSRVATNSAGAERVQLVESGGGGFGRATSVALRAATCCTSPLDELMAEAAAARRDAAFGTRVTFSPKVFVPLTMLCRDRCGYCTFAKPPARLDAPYLTPEQVLADRPAGRRARLPRGAVHPGRSARKQRYPAAAAVARATTATPRRSTTSRTSPRLVARRDRPAPPRQRGCAARSTSSSSCARSARRRG